MPCDDSLQLKMLSFNCLLPLFCMCVNFHGILNCSEFNRTEQVLSSLPSATTMNFKIFTFSFRSKASICMIVICVVYFVELEFLAKKTFDSNLTADRKASQRYAYEPVPAA